VSYPFRLQALLTGRYTAQVVEVYNAGFPGTRASEDRRRLEDAIRDTNPEVLLLLHGANDLNRFGASGIGRVIGSLEGLIDAGTSRGVAVFIATLPPQRGGAGSKGDAAEFLDVVNAAIREMALDEGAVPVDLFGGMTLAEIGSDGLHPTEAGYERMAEIWFAALRLAYEPAEEEAARHSSAPPGGSAWSPVVKERRFKPAGDMRPSRHRAQRNPT
jgi:lysophospholipase L1-like esterase